MTSELKEQFNSSYDLLRSVESVGPFNSLRLFNDEMSIEDKLGLLNDKGNHEAFRKSFAIPEITPEFVTQFVGFTSLSEYQEHEGGYFKAELIHTFDDTGQEGSQQSFDVYVNIFNENVTIIENAYDIDNDVGFYEVHSQSSLSELTRNDDDKIRLFELINQLEFFHDGLMDRGTSDLLKASYTENEKYQIVFGTEDPDQLYNAVYQAGQLIHLHPENEQLFENLKYEFHYPESVLLNSESVYLLSVSNEFCKQLEEYSSVKKGFSEYNLNEFVVYEQKFNSILREGNPVQRLKELNQFNDLLADKTIEYKSQYELLQQLQPKFEKMMNEYSFNPVIEDDIQFLYKQINNPMLFEKESYNNLKLLSELSSDITNLDLQTIRKEGLEGKLFSNPEQAVAISRFDVLKPFNKEVVSLLNSYTGASNYLESLIYKQISEPKKIVEHYLSIRENIDQYTQRPFNAVEVNLLSKYANQALREAVQTIEHSFEKIHPVLANLNISVRGEVNLDNTLGKEFIEITRKLAEPLKVISSLKENEDISLLTLANVSNVTKEQGEYWSTHAKDMIQNHVGAPIQTKNVDGVVRSDYGYLKKSLQLVINSYKESNPNVEPKLEQDMLAYINKQDIDGEIQVQRDRNVSYSIEH